MNRNRRRLAVSVSLLLAMVAFLAPAVATATPPLPEKLKGVGIDEHLGKKIDLDLTFTGEDGYPVALRKFFASGRPVILDLVYYSCPMLCNLVLNAQTKTLREIPWTPGKEFEVVTISFDPTEDFGLARKKKEMYLSSYERPAPGWHFLTDHDGNAKKLAEQIGFHYRYDEARGQFAHAAAIMILTGEGTVSRYLYGVHFKTRDMRLALTEASNGKVGAISDRVLLFCFHYDPNEKAYTLFATNLMRGGGVLAMLILGLVLLKFWRREHSLQPAENQVKAQ